MDSQVYPEIIRGIGAIVTAILGAIGAVWAAYVIRSKAEASTAIRLQDAIPDQNRCRDVNAAPDYMI